MRRTAVLLLVVLAPGVARAQDATPESIAACMAQNIPEAGQIESVALTVTDRSGGERYTHANIFSRRDAKGLQRVLVTLDAPEDLSGASFLMLEREDRPNDLVLRVPGVEGVKYIHGTEATRSMFGSDFSYEDFERINGLLRPGRSKLLADAELRGRAVWVVETHPADRTLSAYERIVTQIDQRTCVVLRTDLYEPGGRLRRVLTADPDLVRRSGSVWIAHDVRMRDVRDGSSTRLAVESVQSDVPIPAFRFSIDRLKSYEPEGIGDPVDPEEIEVGMPRLDLEPPTGLDLEPPTGLDLEPPSGLDLEPPTP